MESFLRKRPWAFFGAGLGLAGAGLGLAGVSFGWAGAGVGWGRAWLGWGGGRWWKSEPLAGGLLCRIKSATGKLAGLLVALQFVEKISYDALSLL